MAAPVAPEMTTLPLPVAGLAVKSAAVERWEMSGRVAPGHLLSVNAGDAPLRFERRDGARLRVVSVPPNALWLYPAGYALADRVSGPGRFIGALFEPALLGRLVGDAPTELRPELGADEPQLAFLLRSLAAEAEAGGANGPLFAQTLAATVADYLARRFGVRAPSRGARGSDGGLSPRQLRAVFELVEARLGDGPSLAELARAAHLSPFHFARAFRRAVGRSPHGYVRRRRAERARERLLGGDEPLAALARELGYADQSHLSREFRLHFGVSPRAFRRGGS